MLNVYYKYRSCELVPGFQVGNLFLLFHIAQTSLWVHLCTKLRLTLNQVLGLQAFLALPNLDCQFLTARNIYCWIYGSLASSSLI